MLLIWLQAINSSPINITKGQWSAIKNGLTAGDKRIDVVGISGELDFDPSLGEATAPIEVWQPAQGAADCGSEPVCFKEIARIEPADM